MIYAVRAVRGRVKIGFTSKPIESRFREVLDGLEVLTYVRGTLRQEQTIHSLLRGDLRAVSLPVGGEWYEGNFMREVVNELHRWGASGLIRWLCTKAAIMRPAKSERMQPLPPAAEAERRERQFARLVASYPVARWLREDTPRAVERRLREQGLSHSQAKRLVAQVKADDRAA
jgi:hypothetical protein